MVNTYYAKGDTAERWEGMTYEDNLKAIGNDDFVSGTVLVQLISDRKLKLEVFLAKKAYQVNGFDSNAVIYER